MTDTNPVSIQHDATRHRFSTTVEGHEGYLDYVASEGTADGGTLTITHTVVPPAIGGRGIAGQLVRAALDHARASGQRVEPRCSYAAEYMDRHPEYADLRVTAD